MVLGSGRQLKLLSPPVAAGILPGSTGWLLASPKTGYWSGPPRRGGHSSGREIVGFRQEKNIHIHYVFWPCFICLLTVIHVETCVGFSQQKWVKTQTILNSLVVTKASQRCRAKNFHRLKISKIHEFVVHV